MQKAVSLYSQLRCFSSSFTCAKPQERSAGLNANPKNESCTKNEKIDALVVLSHVALLFEIFQLVFFYLRMNVFRYYWVSIAQPA